MYKPPHILITLLTSNGLKYLKESVKCILNQKQTLFQYSLIIVVNTLKDNYYDTVVKTFPNIKIIRTKSNGKPGKGHNSLLQIFKENPQYDFIIPIDGDDYLYPYAVSRIERYISNYKVDVLFLMYSDQLSYTLNCPNVPHIEIDNKAFLIWNFNHITDKQWYIDKGPNPFENNINKLNTPGRLMVLSRKMIPYNIYYQEECSLYDDYYPFMQIFEQMYNSDIVVIKTGDTNLLLYNKLIEGSASNKYLPAEQAKEETAFRTILDKSNFKHILKWDLHSIPHQQFPEFYSFGFRDKYTFLIELLNNLDIPVQKKKRSSKDAVYWYNIFMKEGYRCSNMNIVKVYKDIIAHTINSDPEQDINS
jgi:hypothetical protein